jgi:hypothetical protein
LPQIKEIKKKGITGQKKIKVKKEFPSHNASNNAIKDFSGLSTLEKAKGKKLLYQGQ